MPVNTQEIGFEETIEYHLLQNGYLKGEEKDFDKDWGLDTKTLFEFIDATQPDKLERLKDIHGENYKTKFLDRLDRVIKKRGLLDVLRTGVKDRGVHIDLVQFAPASGLNPEIEEKYKENRLKVTRQFHYSKRNNKSVDMVLIVNGFPIITIELKNPMTGQTVEDAKQQYKRDRNPNELIFHYNKRSLVHFALDPDEAYMTTELRGKDTTFLPFNKGHDGGAGNPPNPDGYRTEYLWREVLERDSLLDILGRFMYIKEETEIKGNQEITDEIMIFPRYHQLDAVRKITADVEEKGVGNNYLVQHSTGSGKSITISWLAHHFSELHDANDEIIFDSIVVISDLRILDQQLQDTIYQFNHKTGVVQKIDESSEELAQALKAGAKIIISTIHKFSYILDQIGQIPERDYAVIVDEGHRSQGGELSKSLNKVLGEYEKKREDKDIEDYQDELIKDLDAMGPKNNLSFFAFTATPKPKTLEKFGTTNDEGKPEPFHLYSMRQAIEEGFILDVLKNYTTYKTYYQVAKKVEEDPELEKRKATKEIAKYVELHPHNIAQKTQIMIEHFRRKTKNKINGKAKAMLVTSSRKRAVKYKKAFDKYIRENNYTDIGTLVAFSGTVTDEDTGKEYTESGMNNFSEDELPRKFKTDQYQVLIVAEKYQTGFDEPLLHTMFVDKKLSGLKAVQTLSRLNRTCEGKHDTFVLDFVNDAEDIQKAFKPYYEQTMMEETTDPNLIIDLKYKLDDYQIYWQSEVEQFNKVFFKPKKKQNTEDQSLLNSYIDSAVKRYREKQPEEKQEFKSTLSTFVRQYSFIMQIYDMHDTELHKLYNYGKFLLKKLPKDRDISRVKLDNEVTLEYYRIEQTNSGDFSLGEGETEYISGTTDAGTGDQQEEEKESLSEIIKIFNEHFGTDFTEADKLFVDQIEEDMLADERLEIQAKNNSKDNFKYAFKDAFEDKAHKRMDQNQEIFIKMMNDDDFQKAIINYLFDRVYDELSETG
ncbi:type I restriction endonuclease subunit R [Halarsenatibacter silvermanii]|uniref:Type I restriction enzyme, R subunit n=1 Tax=Halarsenatibacter silvermanii TaxID=321763 RepID=A0A1G9KTV7_9FIRM|nr:type I restriction endonuclease [Halarsenatibacter silvermanii]SDL52903.1 type I restriction enzyme, R subunit [Halarsenatibacter silvermanii]